MTASYVIICLYTCSDHSEPRASKRLHLQLPRQHRQPGRSAHGLARRPQLRAWRWVWKLEIPPVLHQLVAMNGISTIFEMGKLWKMRVSVSDHCMFWVPYFQTNPDETTMKIHKNAAWRDQTMWSTWSKYRKNRKWSDPHPSSNSCWYHFDCSVCILTMWLVIPSFFSLWSHLSSISLKNRWVSPYLRWLNHLDTSVYSKHLQNHKDHSKI